MANPDLIAEIRDRITFPDGHADVWPMFYDPDLFNRIIDALAEHVVGAVTKVAGIESRGFLLGAATAARLGVGFVAIRKQAGRFPGPKLTEEAMNDTAAPAMRCVCSTPPAVLVRRLRWLTIGVRPAARPRPRDR